MLNGKKKLIFLFKPRATLCNYNESVSGSFTANCVKFYNFFIIQTFKLWRVEIETSQWLLFEDTTMTDEVQSDVMIDNLDTSVATMDLITAITADIIEKVHNHNQWNKHTNISPTESHVYTVL